MSLSKSSDVKKSSPKRLLLKLSPRRIRSAPSSPNNSPRLPKASSLSSIFIPPEPQINYICQWCESNLNIKMDKMLAIKCTCNPSMYFCSKLCHRSHWIDPSIGRCQIFKFKDIDSDINWDESKYVLNKSEYTDKIKFPVSTETFFDILDHLHPFKDNIDFNELFKTIANLNLLYSYKLMIVPIFKDSFYLEYSNKKSLRFGEYNILLQELSPYFRNDKIPELITMEIQKKQKNQDIL